MEKEEDQMIQDKTKKIIRDRHVRGTIKEGRWEEREIDMQN